MTVIPFVLKKCLRKGCKNAPFVCRVNRNRVRVVLCELHWKMVELALD